MTQRLRTIGLAFAILIVGMGLIIAATEYAASADSDTRQQLALRDAISAIEQQGIISTSPQQIASRPLLSITGTALPVDDATIEIYVFPSVADRVAEEQVIQQHILRLNAITTTADAPLRATSARNLLLLYQTDSNPLTTAIHAAARTLAKVEVR